MFGRLQRPETSFLATLAIGEHDKILDLDRSAAALPRTCFALVVFCFMSKYDATAKQGCSKQLSYPSAT